MLGRTIVGVIQSPPPSTVYGAEHAVTGFRLDDGSVLFLEAVEDPTGDRGYVTAHIESRKNL